MVLLYGARQVGKTTLILQILDDFDGKTLHVDGDRREYVEVLSSRDLDKMKRMTSGYDLLFIDEAQRIPDIGINLKILHDNLPNLKIIATGSSSFELASEVSEPLTGRVWSHTLYPISVSELHRTHNRFELDRRIDEFLQYGMYPEVFSIENAADKEEFMRTLSSSYLYKDILDLTGIRHSNKIRDLLRLLAFQVGSTVSFNELGRSLGLSTETVQHYIDLLEKSFVIFRLTGFSRNLRKEIVKSPKIYFNDIGIMNAVLENFNPPSRRQDYGKLWENFLIVERAKLLSNNRKSAHKFFWRTYTGAEIDYIEEARGMLRGYECQWGNKRSKVPKTWSETYPEAGFEYVNRENYLGFILKNEDPNQVLSDPMT